MLFFARFVQVDKSNAKVFVAYFS